MMTIESITESGTFRFGSFVSSASGAEASHPVRPWTVKTTASEEGPAPAGIAGRIEDVERDAGPGGRVEEPEDREAQDDGSISRPPVTTMKLVESLIPSHCR